MSEQTLSNEPASGQVLTTREVSVLPGSKLASQRVAEDMTSVGVAIAFAGAAYPIVLVIGWSIVALALSGMSVLEWDELGKGFAMLFVYAFFGAIVGFFWAGIVAFGILMLVQLFVRSLGLQVSIIPLGAFCGGLVGFIAVMPFIFLIRFDADLLGLAVALAVGPALTTVMGQIGGAWGGSRVRGEWAIDGPSRSGRFQFGIRHVMVACVWMALLLTVIRLSGVDFLLAFALLFGWLVFQVATLWIGGLLIAWFRRWKFGRQSRST
jgi:hypothetical protein